MEGQMVNKLRIWIAKKLLGDGITWGILGKVNNTPYYRLCERLNSITDLELPESRRIYGERFRTMYMERTVEVINLHRALTRKSAYIEQLKAKLREAKRS
jgi:hypothetical protein